MESATLSHLRYERLRHLHDGDVVEEAAAEQRVVRGLAEPARTLFTREKWCKKRQKYLRKYRKLMKTTEKVTS